MFDEPAEIALFGDEKYYYHYVQPHGWPPYEPLWKAEGAYVVYGHLVRRESDNMYGYRLDHIPDVSSIQLYDKDDGELSFQWSADEPTIIWVPDLEPGMRFGVAYTKESFESRARRTWDG